MARQSKAEQGRAGQRRARHASARQGGCEAVPMCVRPAVPIPSLAAALSSGCASVCCRQTVITDSAPIPISMCSSSSRSTAASCSCRNPTTSRGRMVLAVSRGSSAKLSLPPPPRPPTGRACKSENQSGAAAVGPVVCRIARRLLCGTVWCSSVWCYVSADHPPLPLAVANSAEQDATMRAWSC